MLSGFPTIARTTSTALLTGLILLGCGDGAGKGAQEPPPFVPPAAELQAAKDPKFKPLIAAILARHAADDALGAYRGSIGDDMDEAQRAEFNRLFGVVQASSKPIGDFVNRESWSDDDRVVMDLIMSLPLDQLKSLK